MPPKKKQAEINQEDLPEINRLILQIEVANIPGLQDRISEVFSKTKRKDTLIIEKKAVLQFAESNELYIDPELIDPKKKLPEGVPTELTPQLLQELYIKFIDDSDAQGRKFKFDCLDAKEKGKPLPEDSRFQAKADNKKKIPDKKKKGEEKEEIEEPELPDGDFTSTLDYIYILTDFGRVEEERALLEGYENVIFCTSLVTGVLPRKQSRNIESDLKLLKNQTKDSEQFLKEYRAKIEGFISGAIKNPEKSTEDGNSEIEESANELKELIDEKVRNGKLKGWSAFLFHFDTDKISTTPETKNVSWEYYFRESLIQRICEMSKLREEYLNWLLNLKLYPISDSDPAVIVEKRKKLEEIQKREEEERLEIERLEKEKNDKKPKKKPDKKQTTKNQQETATANDDTQPPEEFQLKESPSIAKNQQLSSFAKPTEFDVMNNQLLTLSNSQITPGVILEGYLYEIAELLEKNDNEKDQEINEDHEEIHRSFYPDYLDKIFAKLISSKLVVGKDILLENKPAVVSTNLTCYDSKNFSIYYDADQLSRIHGDVEFSNRDPVIIKERNIFENIRFPWIDEMFQLAQLNNSKIDAKLEKTVKCSNIERNIPEYLRKYYIMKFEKMFNEKEPLRTWDFSNRVIAEEIDNFTLKQHLLQWIEKDSDIISMKDDKLGLYYLGFYFKSPPGRQYYRQWKNADKLIPSFEKWEREYSKSPPPKTEFFNISEEEIGEILEQRSLFNPTDGATLDIRTFSVKHRRYSRIIVRKSRMAMGIKEPFDDGNRELTTIVTNKISEEKEESISEEGEGNEIESQEHNISEELQEQGERKEEFPEEGCEYWLRYDSGTRVHAEIEPIVVEEYALASDK